MPERTELLYEGRFLKIPILHITTNSARVIHDEFGLFTMTFGSSRWHQLFIGSIEVQILLLNDAHQNNYT